MALRFLVLAALVGCNGGKESSASKRSGIVSLSPALTDTIIALGAVDQLVGISRYCTMPKGVVLPRLGGVQDLPLEAIQSLRPRLVITTDSRHGPAEKLRLAGVPVEQFSEGTLNDVLKTFSQLGAMIGRPEKFQSGPEGSEVRTAVRTSGSFSGFWGGFRGSQRSGRHL